MFKFKHLQFQATEKKKKKSFSNGVLFAECTVQVEERMQDKKNVFFMKENNSRNYFLI